MGALMADLIFVLATILVVCSRNYANPQKIDEFGSSYAVY